MKIECFRKNLTDLYELETSMQSITDLIHKYLFEEKAQCSKEEFAEISEQLDRFTDLLFNKVNFPLLQVSFHTNWNHRMFEEVGQIRRLRESKPKVDAIKDLFSQLSPEEKALLAKKLGGS